MRKAQAATEFLTTYGISLLAVLVLGGVLAYFGYLNPHQFSPSSCSTGDQVICDDYLITEHTLYITLANALSEPITITGINSTALNPIACQFPTILPGLRQEVVCSIAAVKGEKISTDLAVTFKSSAAEHTVRGSLSSIVEDDSAILGNCPDLDGDGFYSEVCGGDDCEDRDASINPGAPELCYGGIDENCDGNTDVPPCLTCDADGDGFTSTTCHGNDCDDNNEIVYSGNSNPFCDCDRRTGGGSTLGVPEVLDGADNDCDGLVDEGLLPVEDCGNPSGDADNDGCIASSDSYCGGSETCNTYLDDNCNQLINCQEPSCYTGNEIICTLCEDGIKDGTETDVDCGTYCLPCTGGKTCSTGNDCVSGNCKFGKCVGCDDGIKNQNETDIDCGGVCAEQYDQKCDGLDECRVNSDCKINHCCPSTSTCAIGKNKKGYICVGMA
ncbi:MAG: putative metal-binding motif-containing protein [Candidatus Woesearchaeota archaeon]